MKTNEVPWFERAMVFNKTPELLPYFIERLSGTSARIKQKVNGISDEILRHPPQGKWSIKQHIGHLADVDEIANKRIDEMVQGISPMSPAVFEPKRDYNNMPVTELIALFEQTRNGNIQKYLALSFDELKRSSIHPRLKVPMSPADLAWFDAEHDDHHLVTINGILLKALK